MINKVLMLPLHMRKTVAFGNSRDVRFRKSVSESPAASVETSQIVSRDPKTILPATMPSLHHLDEPPRDVLPAKVCQRLCQWEKRQNNVNVRKELRDRRIILRERKQILRAS